MKTSRRTFLQKASAGTLAAGFIPGIRYGKTEARGMSGSMNCTGPDEYQQSWMKLKFGMFIHFGINTYYDTEWSSGDLDISVFNPVELDTDRWCELALKAGMKYIVLVAKHHDGFCLWPTWQTEYSVKNTPFGKDILGMLASSARKYGLKLGLYYSLWDSNNPLHDTNEYAYVEFMKAQLSELMTGYGEVVELWFDGFWKKQQSGWSDKNGEHTAPEAFIRAWRMEGAYRWQMDHLYQFVKQIQPACIVMNNGTSRYKGVPLHPVDAICGEKALSDKIYRKTWPWLGEERYFPMQIEATMSVKGNERFPSGNWFWKEWDRSVASVQQVKDWLTLAAKQEANLLLNCGPSPNGKLRPEDINVLTSLGN